MRMLFSGMANIHPDELLPVDCWETGKTLSKGYTDGVLIERLVTQFHKDQLSRQHLDSFWSIRQCHLLLGYGLACSSIASPTVADVGGGNGYMFDWIRLSYPSQDLHWTIFESREVAEAYARISKGPLKYRSSSELDASMRFDLTILSGALQYLENWQEILDLSFRISKFVLIMRTPLIDSVDSKVFIQKPKTGLYETSDASWPIRLISRKEFESHTSSRAQLIFSAHDPQELFPWSADLLPMETFLFRTPNLVVA
jgi:putative methyltransferase (TIGR04325 family)